MKWADEGDRHPLRAPPAAAANGDDAERLRAIAAAARDGEVTTAWEDAAVAAVGGAHAAAYGEISRGRWSHSHTALCTSVVILHTEYTGWRQN